MKRIITFLWLFGAILFVAKSQVLLNESFENGIPATWLNLDNDGDGFRWELLSNDDGFFAHSGNYSVVSFSWENDLFMVLYPDNYLITPAISIPAQGATLTYWVAAQDPDYSLETYHVKVSTMGTSPANFTTIYQEMLYSDVWTQRTVSLNAYAGQTINIAFVHCNSADEFAMKIDDIVVQAAGTPPPPPPPGYATIILEAHDVWGDGTGYQILLDADATEYANMPPAQYACGSSYAAFEYKLPLNAASNDAFVVANGVDSIHIPAGIYDYVVLNPGCADFSTIFIASSQCSPAKGDDFLFEAGRKYHFYMSLLGQNDCVTLAIDDTPQPPGKSVDLGIGFVDDDITMYIDSMTVPFGDDFSPIFYLYNWDGDTPSLNDYDDTLYIGMTFNGVDSGIIGWIDFTYDIFAIGDFDAFAVTSFLSAAEIANAGLLGGTYECCIYLVLNGGWSDPELSDNHYCMYVTFLGGGGVNTYTINSSAGAGGTISPSGINTYNAGSNQTYQITPNHCYGVQDVIVDGVSVGAMSNYTFNNIQANHTIGASFFLLTYTVSVTAGANGTISYGTYTVPAGTTQQFTVNCGDQPNFTFHPNNGYQIASVTVDGINIGTPGSYQFSSLSANATISVIFAEIPAGTFVITSSAGAGGTISPSGTQNFSAGASQTYTITPNTCYRVADVLVDGSSIGAQSSYTFSNIQANHTITASFAQITYTITVTAGANGTITYGTHTVPAGTSQQFTINCGEEPTFNFYPNDGYQVADVQVNGNSIGTPSSYQFTNLAADASLNVSFISPSSSTFTITANAGPGGSIIPAGTQSYNAGSTQTYTITPDHCFRIVDVLVDGSSIGAVGTYAFSNISADHTIAATFEEITYTVTVIVGNGGSAFYAGTVIPENSTQQFTFECGGRPTFEFIPNGGLQVTDIKVNGNSVGNNPQYQLPPLSGDVILEVFFGESSSIRSYENRVLISPNPAKNHLAVEALGFTEIEILNYLGQTMLTTSMEEPKTVIPISHLSNGIYFVRLIGNEMIVTRKFIKE